MSGEPSIPSSPVASSATRRPSLGGRFREWLWASGRYRELKRELAYEAGRVQELDHRARAAADLGVRAQEGTATELGGPMHFLACELFRESMYWSLAALERLRRGDLDPGLELGAESPPAAGSDAPAADPPSSDPGDGVELESALSPATERDPETPETLERLWREVALTELEVAALPFELRVLVGLDFTKSFRDFAELPPPEQALTAQRLRRVAEHLLKLRATKRRRLESLRLLRAGRVGLLGFVLLPGFLAVSMLGGGAPEGRDVARGKPWRASSRHSSPACRSPEQRCLESPGYFFHTQEESRPWLEIDLGAIQRVSGARVVNRLDCCPDRAVPLTLHVSPDQKSYVQVGRKDDAFGIWQLRFPETQARYVRVRAERRTLLHLSEVNVFAP